MRKGSKTEEGLRKGKTIKVVTKKTASGLTIPAAAIPKPCHHDTVKQRIRPQLNQYVCEGCNEKVFFVVLQATLMTQPELEEYQRKMNEAILARVAEQRREGLGLVLPGDKDA